MVWYDDRKQGTSKAAVHLNGWSSFAGRKSFALSGWLRDGGAVWKNCSCRNDHGNRRGAYERAGVLYCEGFFSIAHTAHLDWSIHSSREPIQAPVN